MKDDDEQEENTFGVTRYACMPSLVALQQMRNRLHLAFLGRKLMKWTALATGRELRKIAIELDSVIKGFGEEMRNAFILLARARYFCPEMNKIVVENIGPEVSMGGNHFHQVDCMLVFYFNLIYAYASGVVVIPTVKAVSAVKIVQFEIAETGVPPYPHLGIEKGGQAVMDAKKAWLELLKKLIMMMQLRTSFLTVEMANKNATKRMNVMKKIVIPKLNVTAEYILSELEELAREEFHRLKKVKEKKRKDNKKKHDHKEGHVCPICDKRTDKTAKVVIEAEPGYFLQAKPIVEPEKPIPKSVEQKLPELVPLTESYKTLSTPVSTTCPSASICPAPSTCPAAPTGVSSMTEIENRLNFIKRQITNIIITSKDFMEMGISTFDINEFLKVCEEAKIKIERFFETETPRILNDDDLDFNKCCLKDVVGVPKDIQKDDKANQTVQVEELKTYIDDVMQMAQDYQSEGLLTPGVDEFIRSCTIIKAKIEGKPIPKTQKDIDEEKLDHLKDHVSELEELTLKMQEKKITSASIEKFVSSCKEFKRKIEEDREKLKERKALQELSQHIDRTVSIGKDAQKEGLLGESVENFIKSIGDVKQSMSHDRYADIVDGTPEPNVLDALKLQIDSIIKSVARLRSGNILSVSADKFLDSCEDAKARIDLYQKYSPVDLEKRVIYPTCSDRCVCDGQNVHEETCDRCQNMADVLPYVEELPPPCVTCDQNPNKKAASTESICITCSQPIEADILLPEPTPNITPQASNVCEVCEGHMIETESVEEDTIKPAVDSSLGYFEKKVRTITKVKRTQNPDGTIREETETITVRTQKHDPTETSLLDDDENEEYDVSYESLLNDDDNKHIAVCSTPNQNQRGFLYLNNKAKSEMILRVSQKPAPVVNHCVSYDMFIDFKDSNSTANDSISIELNVCSLYCNSNMVQRSPLSDD